MAQNDFDGSIAQNNLTYSISTTVQTVVGSNFYTPMIFIGSGANTTANFVTPPATGSLTTVNASNFSTIVKGSLLAWLTPYFAVNNGLTAVNLVVYDSTVGSYGGLTTAYQAKKTLSYHKFIFEPGTAGDSKIALATLCAADPLLSQFWTGTSDAGSIVTPLASGLAYQLSQAAVEACITYSAQSGIEAGLVALALQLSYLNPSGTSVGNEPGAPSTTAVYASGTTGGSDNSNVTATGQANLKTNNIMYFETVGNGTGAVAIIGDQTNKGNYSSAQWFSAYLQYKSKVDGASYLASTPRPGKTETTYNNLVNILQTNAYPFTQGSQPIISNFTLVNYPYNKAPASAGNTFTITGPAGYAWTALFNRGLTYATITGNLTVQA